MTFGLLAQFLLTAGMDRMHDLARAKQQSTDPQEKLRAGLLAEELDKKMQNESTGHDFTLRQLTLLQTVAEAIGLETMAYKGLMQIVDPVAVEKMLKEV